MKRVPFLLLAFLVSCGRPASPPQPSAEQREAAYRANNRGVALLEQFQHEAAAAVFRDALQQDPSLRLARINLPIALFYAGLTQEAATEAAAARERYPDAPQPHYLIGLIDRAENRNETAVQAFRRVLELDPNDVGAKVNLALVHVQQQEYKQAATLSESALAVEPFNATAAYNLAMSLTRLGDPRGEAAFKRFEELRTAPYAITYSQTYLEQGRYAEGITSTGAEPELVATASPAVTFVDATPAAMAGESKTSGAVTLTDLDGDGDLDVVSAGTPLRVFRNDGPMFADITRDLGLAAVGPATGAAASDFNNDTRTDLLILGPGGVRLFAQQQGGMREVAANALPASARALAPSAAFADADHDGDLDIVLGGTTRLLRNNGNGAFQDVTQAAGLQGVIGITAIAPTDFDNRRDIDLLMASSTAAPRLFRNLRTGAFEDVAGTSGFPAGAVTTVAAGDVNKDGFIDIFLGRGASAGAWALSDGRGRFRLQNAPAASQGASAAQIVDYDNDGLLDLAVITSQGARLFRNAGAIWSDETSRVFPADFQQRLQGAGAASLAAGDLDLDGDTDLAAYLQNGGLRIWRNEGGSRNPSLRVRLEGRVSNRQGVGAKVEVRAASLFQKIETASTTPSVVPADVVFGLGPRREADVVRVLWPAGILQAETTLTGPSRTAAGLAILELNRKPSSCPYLYTWNGREFVFITDFMGGGEMGYWHAPGVRNVPDPTEYVRITDDQLQPRDGRLEVRVTNELEETLFVDHLSLLAITHPADVLVFPDEGLREKERPRLVAVTSARPPAAAVDEHGHDLLPAISRMDRKYPDDFDRLPIRGYAREHEVTIDVPADLDAHRAVLLLTGWTDYAFSMDNVAAHQAGLALTAPVLQVRDAAGHWQTIDADVGIPVGRPQTLVLDLAKALPRGRRLRLVTSMRIYWDQILVAESVASDFSREWFPRLTANLSWRGFSAEVSPDGREPYGYDYERVLFTSPWKLMPGRYTREGNVEELLRSADDRFVISRPGDEVTLSFDASRLSPLPDGMRRTYLLNSVGYSKEMDLHSASPDQTAPIPFRAMTQYPYTGAEKYPHEADLERFHTRRVGRPVPSLP